MKVIKAEILNLFPSLMEILPALHCPVVFAECSYQVILISLRKFIFKRAENYYLQISVLSKAFSEFHFL